MTIRQYFKYLGLFVIGIILMISFIKFSICFKEMEHVKEDFTYIYRTPFPVTELREKCKKNQIICQITSYEENRDNVQKEILSIVKISDMKILNYHKIENLFLDSDIRIDVNLFKWIVYIFVGIFFLGIIIFCLCQSPKSWKHIIVIFFWLLYIKLFVFTTTKQFPIWSLPGKWSDLEGWGNLWKAIQRQITYIIYFKDNPIINNYYQYFINGICYLFLILILFYLFLKTSLKVKNSQWLYIGITVITFLWYINYGVLDLKMVIYFFPCIILCSFFIFDK